MSRSATFRTTFTPSKGFAVSGSFWAQAKELAKNIITSNTTIFVLRTAFAFMNFFIALIFWSITIEQSLHFIKYRKYQPAYNARNLKEHLDLNTKMRKSLNKTKLVRGLLRRSIQRQEHAPAKTDASVLPGRGVAAGRGEPARPPPQPPHSWGKYFMYCTRWSISPPAAPKSMRPRKASIESKP